jgi:glycosyltransferase involved in cell wall biosynthesis
VARALVVETELEAALLREFAPANRIRIIPPGVDLSVWNSRDDVALPADVPPRFVLYSGRIESNKGLQTLVRAIALWPRERRLPLVVMGRDWGEQPALEQLARELGVSADLRWLGHVEPPLYRAVFRRAAVFVLPSEWEAFGLVLLEAMAAGRPIVATAVGGVPEVLEHGRAGRLVPYGNARDLMGALDELASDPSLAEPLVRAGRERVAQLTWNRAVERHRALYRTLVG